jgi:hypothetical protein
MINNMKKQLILYVLFFVCSINLLSQNSHIQVMSESGISVFLDGQFKGTTSSEYGGIIIQNIPSGQHIIKVVKEGYLPQEETISIKAGEVFTYRVNKEFLPSIKISEKGNQENQAISIKKGNFKIQSLPIEIKIVIPALQINALKSKDEWFANDIPEGLYKVTYNWNGKTLEDNIPIENEMVTYAFVNMVDGKIENKSIKPVNEKTVEIVSTQPTYIEPVAAAPVIKKKAITIDNGSVYNSEGKQTFGTVMLTIGIALGGMLIVGLLLSLI